MTACRSIEALIDVKARLVVRAQIISLIAKASVPCFRMIAILIASWIDITFIDAKIKILIRFVGAVYLLVAQFVSWDTFSIFAPILVMVALFAALLTKTSTRVFILSLIAVIAAVANTCLTYTNWIIAAA